MVLLTVILFIGLLLVLVIVHEWGHFMAAKKAGCTVEEFGFGFPPRLFSFMWHGTRYSLNALPIGGFVKIEGENMGETNPAPTSFASKSAPWRIIILSAGVIMNVVLAAVLLSVQAGLGTPAVVTDENASNLSDLHTYILELSPHSPADEAGIQPFDRIVKIGDVSHPTIEAVQDFTKAHTGQEISLELERGGQHVTISLVPRVNPPEGEGALGVSLAATGLTKVPWYQAPLAGMIKTGQMVVAIGRQFGIIIYQLVVERSVTPSLTGPIGIAVYTNEVAKLGTSYFLEFAAMISLNLAIINILPLPALDGGRILFVLFELIFRRRLPNKIESWAHTAGFALLIGLMILVTLKDVRHYF